MPLLKSEFNELMERIQRGREFGHASFEPIYYLVFSPDHILEVKRQTPAWIARLRNEGWNVTAFSIADAILELMKEAPLRKIWITADQKNPLNWDKTNKSLANYLTSGVLQQKLEDILAITEKQQDAIVLVTDLEALHPYLRIGAIERQLQGKFNTPTVFFYPGERTGKTRLKFLGFYPDDGNYRSVHVGG